MSGTPRIILNIVDGIFCAVGPATTLTPALDGTRPIALDGVAAGDVVYAKASHTTLTWRDGIGIKDQSPVVKEISHPKFGKVIAVRIDDDRLGGAPWTTKKIRSVDDQRRTAIAAAKEFPACGRCGECPLCGGGDGKIPSGAY